MKIQYEVGDQVFEANNYGGHSYEVTAVRKYGVVLVNEEGETFFRGYRQIEPTPGTVISAEIIRGGK